MKQLIGYIVAIGLLTACGNMESLKECAGPACQSKPTQPFQSLEEVNLDADITHGVHAETQAIAFDSETKVLSVSLPISGGGFLTALGNLSIEIPGLEGATVSVGSGEADTAIVTVDVPIASVINGIGAGQASGTLPNGSKLPEFPMGEHPYFDFTLTDGFEGRLYVNEGAIGLYVTVPFNPFIQITYPIETSEGQILGHLTQIPEKDEFSGGFFLGVALSEELVEAIGDLI